MKYLSFRLVSNKELNKKPAHCADSLWDTEKDDFISTATHQLRSPLTGVKWTLDMLLHGEVGKLSKEQETLIKTVDTSNERVIDMVDAMLNALRVDAGAVKFISGEFDINLLIKDLVEELLSAAKEKKIKLTISGDKDVPKVVGDELKLRVAYQNLVHNAIKYTPEGGKVTVMIIKKDNVLEINVKDNGIGIPVDEQKDMFRRFFRGSNAMLDDPNGTGLGLYITKNVLERHGGKIWFETEKDKGTTFFTVLPYDGLEK